MAQALGEELDIYPKDVREFRLFSAKGKPHRQISTIHNTIAAQRAPMHGPTGEPYGRAAARLQQQQQPGTARRVQFPRSLSLSERQLCDALPSEDSTTQSFHFWRLSAREKLLLLSFALGDFFIFLCFSVIAPFFPAEVSSKGGSTTMAGMIFAQYALVSCIAAPVFGHVLPHLGARWTLLMGLFVCGASNIIFGFLDDVDDKTLFITYCFITRSVEAVGAAAYATSSYALLAHEFPDFIVPAFGILEAFVGLGLTVGPAVGGALFALGGYKLPFVLLGGCLLVSPMIFYSFLPPEPQQIKLPRSRYSDLLCNPKALAVSFVITVISGVWSFLDPILEPHLRPLNLSAEVLGLLFLLTAATYTISSPIWGWFGDRITSSSESLMLIGLILTSVVMLFFGPSPLVSMFLPIKETLWLNIVCLAALGLFVSMALIPTFDCLLTAVLENSNMEENFATYSLVSGLWSASYSLGEVLGPLAGGVIFDNYGFAMASTVMSAASLLAAAVLFFEYIRRRVSRYRRTQRFLKYGPSPTPGAESKSNKFDFDDDDADEADENGISPTNSGNSNLSAQSHHTKFFYYANNNNNNNGSNCRREAAAAAAINVNTWVVKNLHRQKLRRQQTMPAFLLHTVADDDDDNDEDYNNLGRNDADNDDAESRQPQQSAAVVAAAADKKRQSPAIPPVLPLSNPAAVAATSALLTRFVSHRRHRHNTEETDDGNNSSSRPGSATAAAVRTERPVFTTSSSVRIANRHPRSSSPMMDSFLLDTQQYQEKRLALKRNHSRSMYGEKRQQYPSAATASSSYDPFTITSVADPVLMLNFGTMGRKSMSLSQLQQVGDAVVSPQRACNNNAAVRSQILRAQSVAAGASTRRAGAGQLMTARHGVDRVDDELAELGGDGDDADDVNVATDTAALIPPDNDGRGEQDKNRRRFRFFGAKNRAASVIETKHSAEVDTTSRTKPKTLRVGGFTQAPVGRKHLIQRSDSVAESV